MLSMCYISLVLACSNEIWENFADNSAIHGLHSVFHTGGGAPWDFPPPEIWKV